MVSVITDSINNIYMSTNHIYFSYNQEINGEDYTVIHKVFVWRTYIIPFADAKIKGTINDQFSLDEFAGFVLRVALTNENDPLNGINVYAMDYFLRPMGQLNGIYKQHKIRSTRFVGRKLYIGTDVGPFIVVSFYTHYYPRVLGYLNLSGFSRFIYPYNENIMLSFGRNSDSDSNNNGLNIWLIEVSNPNSPRELGFFNLNERFLGSVAEFEHKAFLFDPEKNMVVFPIHIKRQKFNGALYLQIVPSNSYNTPWQFIPGVVNHY